jgi:hypothetical protein
VLVVDGPRHAGGRARRHAVTEVLVVLPGGDRPEVRAEEVDYLSYRAGVPVAGLEEAQPSILVGVSFTRSRACWHVGSLTFEFARTQYDRALCELLVLLGEVPELISDADWTAGDMTRVVPVTLRGCSGTRRRLLGTDN